jgi:hypothetical protein
MNEWEKILWHLHTMESYLDFHRDKIVAPHTLYTK